MTQELEAALVAEQLRHTVDLLRSEIERVTADSQHMREIFEARIAWLEKNSTDYEARLRSLQESSTQFKLLASLATGGGLLSLVALLKATLGA